ncbi:hypothetical protein [Aestuariirhabdus sp. LZHN29]|uniref:hypothetical protein n=1 Tax=Aestuariirhabdus sp. LZHN29 TaxID=3417462 RepID=UPI003CFAEB69
MDPDTGEQLERCPWLRKAPGRPLYTCDIYYDRPDDCKHYPVSVGQMIRDGCEMIEVKDLSDPVQAQSELDEIMEDSWA